MRLLIDGYNLMHAAGRMSRRFGPDGLRRARHRFLNDLAASLGPERASRATVVFDASSLPMNQAPESSHKGISVIYAIEDEDADTRIEWLISRDSAPRSLTVVSTDRRIRRAAQRRRSESLTADEFLDLLDEMRGRRLASRSGPETGDDRERGGVLSPDEVDAWAREFGDFDDEPGTAPIIPDPDDWTDADLDRVAREVEAEFRDLCRPLPPRLRRR